MARDPKEVAAAKIAADATKEVSRRWLLGTLAAAIIVAAGYIIVALISRANQPTAKPSTNDVTSTDNSKTAITSHNQSGGITARDVIIGAPAQTNQVNRKSEQ